MKGKKIIIIEGVEYTEEELNEIEAELLKPTLTQPETPKVEIPSGKGLQFVTDPKLYNEIIKYMDKTFPDKASLLSGNLEFDSNVMKGSNPYIAVAVDMYLKSINSKHRITTQRDLETNLKMFENFYEDTGMALRSLEEPNKSQAEYLHAQIKRINPDLKFPIFIELRNLKLDADLNFNLTSQSRYKTADCLNWENGTNYSHIDDFGLPKIKDKNSSRHVWTIKGGLVRAYLGGCLGFCSGVGCLPGSYDDGRVVLVSAEGGAP